MAFDLEPIKIRVEYEVDNKGLNKDLDVTNKKGDAAGKNLQKSFSGASISAASLSRTIRGLGAAIGISLGTRALAQFSKAMLGATDEGRALQGHFEDLMKSFRAAVSEKAIGAFKEAFQSVNAALTDPEVVNALTIMVTSFAKIVGSAAELVKILADNKLLLILLATIAGAYVAGPVGAGVGAVVGTLATLSNGGLPTGTGGGGTARQPFRRGASPSEAQARLSPENAPAGAGEGPSPDQSLAADKLRLSIQKQIAAAEGDTLRVLELETIEKLGLLEANESIHKELKPALAALIRESGEIEKQNDARQKALAFQSEFNSLVIQRLRAEGQLLAAAELEISTYNAMVDAANRFADAQQKENGEKQKAAHELLVMQRLQAEEAARQRDRTEGEIQAAQTLNNLIIERAKLLQAANLVPPGLPVNSRGEIAGIDFISTESVRRANRQKAEQLLGDKLTDDQRKKLQEEIDYGDRILDIDRNIRASVSERLVVHEDLLTSAERLQRVLETGLVLSTEEQKIGREKLKDIKRDIEIQENLGNLGLETAKQMDAAITQGIASGFRRALETGDINQFFISIGESLTEAIIDAITRGFIQAAGLEDVGSSIFGAVASIFGGAREGGWVTNGRILKMASGGAVPNFGRPFADSVPALLMPGEQVLPVREAEEYRRGKSGGGITVNYTANVTAFDAKSASQAILEQAPTIKNLVVGALTGNEEVRRVMKQAVQ